MTRSTSSLAASKQQWSPLYLFSLSLLLVAILLPAPTSAQGGFFNQFFQQQQHHQAREQEAPVGGDAAWFEARTEAATCTAYLCPRTLSCVPHPSHCPCPFPQQQRCPYTDSGSKTGSNNNNNDGGGFICVSEEDGCGKIARARGMWWDWNKGIREEMKKIWD